MFSPVIFREYDIRGVYNEQFDLDFAYKLGKAFTSYVFGKTAKKALRFSIGYDARTSSLDIVKKLAAGMSESGAEVAVLGVWLTFTKRDGRDLRRLALRVIWVQRGLAAHAVVGHRRGFELSAVNAQVSGRRTVEQAQLASANRTDDDHDQKY